LENQKTVVYEYDLDDFTCKSLTGPQLIQKGGRVPICRQANDGKIYALTCSIRNLGQKSTAQQGNEVWAFNTDSQEWTQVPIANGSPSFNLNCYLLLSDDHFILYGGWESYLKIRKEYHKCWYLPLPTVRKLSKPVDLTDLQRTMKKFLAEAPYSDISFEVQSQIIPAHKWWLSKRSQYFANMFSSGMSETQASQITITDMTAHAFKAFLEFLYSDHVELDYDLALELLQQADKYSVADLKAACEVNVAESIRPENFVVLGNIAELVEAALLRQTVVEYIGKNMKKLKQRKDFEEISDSLLRDSIVKFVGP